MPNKTFSHPEHLFAYTSNPYKRMEVFFETITFLAVIVLIVKLKFDKFVAQFENIPRQPVLTLIGHGYMFAFKTQAQVLKIGKESIIRLGGTALMIIGFTARLFITDPKDIEEILTNRKLIVKSEYFLKDWLGNGLILSDGEKWFTRRKIITKSFHFNILKDFIGIFDRNSGVFVDKLIRFEGQVGDVFPLIALCTLDIVCETSMGIKVNAQQNSNSDYVNAVKE